MGLIVAPLNDGIVRITIAALFSFDGIVVIVLPTSASTLGVCEHSEKSTRHARHGTSQ
jgi:uncharacterized ion transporter superfamily protein YfcC